MFNKYTCKDRELVMRLHPRTCLALCALYALYPTSASADFTFGIGGNMRYSARDWEQLAGTVIGSFMLALNECGDEYDPSCDDREIIESMGFPLAPVQIELSLGYSLSPHLEIGPRFFFRSIWRDKSLVSTWAAGPELTYYIRPTRACWRPYLGAGLFWTHNRFKRRQTFNPSASHSQQWRVGTSTRISHNSNFFIHLAYQIDHYKSAAKKRQTVSLGMGLNFSL